MTAVAMLAVINWTQVIALAATGIGMATTLGGILLWLIMPRIEKKIEDVSKATITLTVNGKVDTMGVQVVVLTEAINRLDRAINRLDRAGAQRSEQIQGIQAHVDKLTQELI